VAPLRLNPAQRNRAMLLAFAGNVLPIAVAVATDFGSHHALFFAGAAGACVAPIVVTAASRRHRFLFYLAAFGGLPALAMMQSYSGGVSSGYAVLMMMAMIWFGCKRPIASCSLERSSWQPVRICRCSWPARRPTRWTGDTRPWSF
jgi:hypothetical protein